MRRLLASVLCLSASPCAADVAEVVSGHIRPGYAAFAEATRQLAQIEDCDPARLQPAWNAAFDAWLTVQHLHLGPAEDQGRGLAIAFWPDPKDIGARQQAELLAAGPAALSPDAFAEQSVAVRGLTALERLLYPAEPAARDTCPLIEATADDLARMATEIDAGWADYAPLLLSPGAAGNTTFLTKAEARQALFTQLAAGLEFIDDQRLGRPLGTFDKPRPERAESRASGRTLRNVALSLRALSDLAERLAPEGVKTHAALARAITLAETLGDPGFQGVADPQGRLKVEILQQAVEAARAAALAELPPLLGVGLGFNSQDGD